MSNDPVSQAKGVHEYLLAVYFLQGQDQATADEKAAAHMGLEVK